MKVGDKVYHVKEIGIVGEILSIDDACGENDITTCTVMWEDSDEPDIQWTNKLVKVE